MLPMAHATDGFGSIRAPAACCGLVGLKPTRGRNTMAPYAGEGLGGVSTEHAVSLSVRDSAALLDATAGPGAGDPYVGAAAGAAVPRGGRRDARACSASPSRRPRRTARRSARRASRRSRRRSSSARDLGHHVEEADPEIDGAAVVPTFLTLAAANTVVNLAEPSDGGPARRGPTRSRA